MVLLHCIVDQVYERQHNGMDPGAGIVSANETH